VNRVLALVAATLVATALVSAQSPPRRYGIGTPATPDQIAALDIDVKPDGSGLPRGSGTAREGASVYAQKCAACHGANGEGGSADPLVGAQPKSSLPFGPEYERWRNGGPDVPFTIGNYWPYATTIFDYVRRAMPATAPGSLTANETYSVVAWLLAKNDIIAESATVNAETLPRVQMPAHAHFVPDIRKGGPEVK
jgi:S-disulfanyl-L-cysteine oxidoreductase SoxD